MAEPIKMQFGMLSRLGPGNTYYMPVHGDADGPVGKSTFEVSGQSKHCKAEDFGGWVKW